VAKQSTHLVVIEENSRIGGLGSAVIDHLNAKGLNKPVLKVALPDAFVTHGSMKELYREIGFDTPAMAENIKRFYRGEER